MNDDSGFCPEPSSFVADGGKLPVSNLVQLQLIQAVTARGAQFRTIVRGQSMQPFVRDNDVLTIAPLDGAAPRVGEIVAFILPDSGQLAIHRIIARTRDGWVIRGDNCLNADGAISGEKIVGRVIQIERRGRAVHFGLGAEARIIALLQREHLLRLAVRVVGWIKKLLRRNRSSSAGYFLGDQTGR